MISDRRVASMPGWAPIATSAAYWTAVRSPPHSSAKYAEDAWCTRRMRWPGNRENDSRTFRRPAAVVIAVDSIEIVRILSNAFRRLPVNRRDDLRRGRRSRQDRDRRGFRGRVGAAEYFRRAELEAGGARSL